MAHTCNTAFIFQVKINKQSICISFNLHIYTFIYNLLLSPLNCILWPHNPNKKNSLNKYTLNKQNTSCSYFSFFFFLPCKSEKTQMLLSSVPVTLYSSVLCQVWLIRFISCCCHYAVESAVARSGLEFLLFCFWWADEGTTSPDSAAVQS